MIELSNMSPRERDELMHYGRLGMKWGEHIFTKAKESASNYKERHKSVKKMTDAELQARLNRARNVEQYKALMRKNDPTVGQYIASGAKFTAKVLGGAAKGISNLTISRILKDGALTIGRAGFQKLAGAMFSGKDDGGYTDPNTGLTLKDIQARNKFDSAYKLYQQNRAEEEVERKATRTRMSYEATAEARKKHPEWFR